MLMYKFRKEREKGRKQKTMTCVTMYQMKTTQYSDIYTYMLLKE